MNYSLGNMLGGAGALNADKLSLDLQFAADKTLTARKGPTPTFTRASGATQVGASGLIEYAPENLTIRSDDFGASEWNQGGSSRNLTVTANNTTSPSGATDADLLTVGATTTTYQVVQGLPNTGNVVSGVTYTVSCYFKANQVTRVSIYAGNPVTMPFDAMFDLTGAGSVVAAAAGTASIQQIGNGWYRCIITATAGATSNTSLRISPVSGTSRTYVGNSVDSFWAWGAQLEASPSARTYIPTTTAAVYGARFDHDPITLACKGLLIEESRTNLALQSENHPSATWSKTGVTVASATNTSPSGSTTSNLVSEDSSTGLHRFFQATAYVTGTSYSISCFFKYAGRQFIAITHPAVAVGGTAIFDIQNGTISLTQSGVTTSITAYPNGWYRCVVNGVSSITASSSHVIQGSTTGGILTGSYTGLNGAAFYIYGSQVEAGAFPTSYIPTTTASVVRSADICSITGSDFTRFYNQSEGTFLTQSIKTSTNANSFIFQASDNSFVNSTDLRYSTVTIPSSVINVASVSQVTGFSGTITSGASTKQALAYKLNDCAYSLNGASAITDTSALIPTVSQLNIGNAYSGTLTINGHIASIRYYKKRLANAKLQALTA